MTITREFTKEQLLQIIDTDHVQCGDASELARIALASLEAEAVACPKCNGTGMADSGGVKPWGEPINVPCDCTAPPAPGVPDCFINAVSALESLHRNGQKQCWNERYTTDMAYASSVIRSCRAAMQGKAVGWVACSERMPDHCDGVWVWSNSGVGYAVEAYYDGDWYRALTDDPEYNITHWQPLPAAPQQESE